jgi:outer membrane protein insertion porin family
MRPRCLLTGLLAGLLSSLAVAGVRAQDPAAPEAPRIVQVEVRGTQTIAKETILAKVQMKPGSPYLDTVVSEDIRRVFALGYFTDVQADVEELPEGLRLVFVVKEKPTVREVRVEGQKALSEARVLELFSLKTGMLYDPRQVKQGIDLVEAEYGRKGFADTEVVSQVETPSSGEGVVVRVLIDEGPRTRIERILVEGNEAFADKRIVKLLKTKRRHWFRAGVYNEETLEEDLERIRAFYRKNGYQDVTVARQVYRGPSGRGLVVHLKIAEGLQHRVGEVALEGALLFPEHEVRQVLGLKPGVIFSDEALQADLRAVKQYYGDQGYIHAEVAPEPQLDPSTKRVNLTYHITEKELVYVQRVEVQGNLRTKDTVVRREIRIYPGEAFDGKRIRKSVDRLYNLGYFEEVNVDTTPTTEATREDLVLRVKESKTGSFSFGGGFSSIDRLVGLIELEQRNFDVTNWPSFTGAGQDLRFKVEIGSVRRYFDLSFTEPWIFGHPVSFGVDAYNRTRLRSRDLGLGYEEERRGGGLRFGKEFADAVQTGLGYQVYQTRISDVVDEASADLKAEEGKNTVSVVSLSSSYDVRDNRFDPTRGLFAFASTDLAGGIFGADKDFYRLQGGASFYQPHFDRFVLESRVRMGVVEAYGDSADVPIFERFFGGGSGTIRGFRERRVGPRDPASNDPIGGEATFLGTLEEVMTIIKDERGKAIIKGSVFLDVGDVWRRVDEFAESFKSGTGVGARVNTPIGPLRLDLGFPISEIEEEGRKPRFHFNVSRSF